MADLALLDRPAVARTPLSLRAERVLEHAKFLAFEAGADHLGTEHLAEALLAEEEGPHVAVLRATVRKGWRR